MHPAGYQIGASATILHTPVLVMVAGGSLQGSWWFKVSAVIVHPPYQKNPFGKIAIYTPHKFFMI